MALEESPGFARKPVPCLFVFSVKLTPGIAERGRCCFYHFSASGFGLLNSIIGYFQARMILFGYFYRLFETDCLCLLSGNERGKKQEQETQSPKGQRSLIPGRLQVVNEFTIL